MTQEQKAKAYDEALERARVYFENENYTEMADVFPELCESEDERIRTFLHHTFTAQYLCKDKTGKWHGEPVTNILAYLEKQKEPHYTKRNELFDKCVESCDPKIMKKVSDVIDKELQKEQKPIQFKNHELADVIKSEFEGFRALLKKKGIDYEPQHIYWDDFARMFDSAAREYVKEQKPAEMDNEETELSYFESVLFSAFSDGWQQYLHGEEVDVAQWAKEHSAELLNAAKLELKPTEWSEEDEDCFMDVKSAVKNYFDEGYAKELCNWLEYSCQLA